MLKWAFVVCESGRPAGCLTAGCGGGDRFRTMAVISFTTEAQRTQRLTEEQQTICCCLRVPLCPLCLCGESDADEQRSQPPRVGPPARLRSVSAGRRGVS